MTNPYSVPAEKPEFLYKYCTVARALRVLHDGYIYLAPIASFNDLFEFAFLALLDENKETPFEYYRKHLTRQVGPEMAHKLIATESDAEVRSMYEKWKKEHLSPALNLIREHSGVTCFSAEADNQRMWAAYGDDHRGVCIEFAIGINGCPFEGWLLPVIYSGTKTHFTFADLMKDDGTLNQDLLLFLSLIKHEHWREENEWRVMFLDNEDRGADARMFRFSPENINRVFLGTRISDDDETRLNAIMREKAPSVPVLKKVRDGLYGTTSNESFEAFSSGEDVISWIKRLHPEFRDLSRES